MNHAPPRSSVSIFTWQEKLRASLLSLVVNALLFPHLVTNPARVIYYQGIDGRDGVFGDASLGLWTLWKNGRNGIKTVNPLNSFPWGEKGFSIADLSQVGFFGPLALVAKLTNPVFAWNSGIFTLLVLGSFSTWWAAGRICKSGSHALLAIPLIASCQFLVWTVGGATALVAYWPVPLLIGMLSSTEPTTKRRGLAIFVLVVIGLLSDPLIGLSCLIVSLLWFAIAWFRGLSSRRALHSFMVVIMTTLLILGATIASKRMTSEWTRSYGEWQAFGARWWMIIPSPRTPIVGSVFQTIRNKFESGQVILSRPAGQSISLGVSLTVLLVWAFVRRFRFSLSSVHELDQAEPRRDTLALLVVLTSFALMLVPSPGNVMGWLYPSHLLHKVYSIWRYTGRLTVLLHVGAVIMVVAQLKLLLAPQDLETSKSKPSRFKVALVVLFAVIPFTETVMAIRGVPRSFTTNEIPEAYEYLSSRPNSPYLDLPGFGSSPFPSNVFQYVSDNPVVDRGSTPSLRSQGVPVDEVVLALESICSPQAPSAVTALGLRYVIYRTNDKTLEDHLQQCGWRVVKTIKTSPRVQKGVFQWPKLQLVLTPVSTSSELAALSIPENGDWIVNWTRDLNYSWTMKPKARARVKLIWLRKLEPNKDTILRINGSFRKDTKLRCQLKAKSIDVNVAVFEEHLEARLQRKCQTIELLPKVESLTIDSVTIHQE